MADVRTLSRPMPEVYPKQFFRNRTARPKKASCFLMMPFAAKFDAVHEVLHETLQSPELNIICRRADDIRSPNILETILASIARSEYIIADLTDRNPNVFYELGVAHCTKDPGKVILLAQSMDDVPFDLRHLRCIVYDDCEPGLAALRSELLATFQAASRNSFRFKVSEGAHFAFGKKLVGNNRNLFELVFNVVHIGYGVVKLTINFAEHAIDQPTSAVEPQFVMLSEDDSPSTIVQNIPWMLHLAHYEDHSALLVLEKP
jgi:hypothetical protein